MWFFKNDADSSSLTVRSVLSRSCFSLSLYSVFNGLRIRHSNAPFMSFSAAAFNSLFVVKNSKNGFSVAILSWIVFIACMTLPTFSMAAACLSFELLFGVLNGMENALSARTCRHSLVPEISGKAERTRKFSVF